MISLSSGTIHEEIYHMIKDRLQIITNGIERIKRFRFAAFVAMLIETLLALCILAIAESSDRSTKYAPEDESKSVS